MESLGILRSLWRHPIAFAVGIVLALVVGAMAHYEVTLSPPSLKSRALESGYAQEHVLVDTQTSLLVDAQAEDAESISTRAIILSDLLADDAAKERMAREAGLQADEIAVVGLGTTIPDVGTPLAERATEVVKPLGRYRIDVSEGPSLPILSVLVSGPDRGRTRWRRSWPTCRPGSLMIRICGRRRCSTRWCRWVMPAATSASPGSCGWPGCVRAARPAPG